MGRRLLALLLLAALLAPAAARADRLGGNYRGPDDVYVVREDPTRGPAPGGGEGGGKPPARGGEGGGDAGGDDAGGDGSGDGPPYRGPAGEVPPNGGRPPEEPPPEDGGGATTPPVGRSSTPEAGGGGTEGGGAAPPSSGGLVRGASHDDMDRIWPFYFERAKEEFFASVLARRPEERLAPPGTAAWVLSTAAEPRGGRRPLDARDRAEAFALVLARLRDPDSHVRDAAILALGKSGSADAVPYLEMAASPDAEPDPQVREDALLALGLTGRAEEVLPVLLDAMARPGPAGEKRAAFAALGLGLLGDPAAAPRLRALLREAAPREDRVDDAVAAAAALGALGDGDALPDFAEVLADPAVPLPVRCHVLHALGRFGADGDPKARGRARDLLLAALDGRAPLRQSALLALGSFGEAGVVGVLARRGLIDPDSHARNFAAHSLGRIAGAAGPGSRLHGFVEEELARFADDDRRDRWLFQAGNLALSSMASADREGVLVGLLRESAALDRHSASSVALSLGMLGEATPAAAKSLREVYGSRTSAPDVRAYAGLALGMTAAPGAAESLVDALLADAPRSAGEARTAALALGLVGGAKEAGVLVSVLGGAGAERLAPGERFFLMGAAVQGLGLIGDGGTVEALRPLLEARRPWSHRAFATAALGYLLEEDPSRRVAPALSTLFRHANHLVPVPVIAAVQSAL